MDRNPYIIQPLVFEISLRPEEQKRIDLIVEVDDALRKKNVHQIEELIVQLSGINHTGILIRKLKEVFNG